MKHIPAILIVMFCALFATACNNVPQKDGSTPVTNNTSEPSNRNYFSVHLSDGFVGNGTKGSYSIYMDSTLKMTTAKATIKSLSPQGDDFATILSSAAPVQSLGKRVRLTGYIKSENVKGWAGLWMRIDSKTANEQSLAFDNMQDRAITGTTDWKKYSVVLDVAQNAGNIVFGTLMAGEGQIWVDSMQVNIVDNSIPVTNMVGKTL